MIDYSFYLTEPDGLEKLNELTELSLDEVESIVGRFRKNHYRFSGLLKGEVCVDMEGMVWIRHHFTKKKLWEN